MTDRERSILEAAAKTILADFRLTQEERDDETALMAVALVAAIDYQLDLLKHCRLPRRTPR